MTYYTVCPRDLFAQAKLLKCLARLSLLIHDGDQGWPVTNWQLDHDGDGFPIRQDPNTGYLSCPTVRVTTHDGEPIYLHTGMPSKEMSADPWPLWADIEVNGAETTGKVFDENGKFCWEPE
jgi:hypothetical protein